MGDVWSTYVSQRGQIPGQLIIGSMSGMPQEEPMPRHEQTRQRPGFEQLGSITGLEQGVPREIAGIEQGETFPRHEQTGQRAGSEQIGQGAGFEQIGQGAGFEQIGQGAGFEQVGPIVGFEQGETIPIHEQTGQQRVLIAGGLNLEIIVTGDMPGAA